jgi:hypothetical protein
MSKNSPNTALYIIASIVLVAIIGFIMIQYSGGSGNTPPSTSTETGSNVEVRDEIQYITIDAKGGYKPRNTTAK